MKMSQSCKMMSVRAVYFPSNVAVQKLGTRVQVFSLSKSDTSPPSWVSGDAISLGLRPGHPYMTEPE